MSGSDVRILYRNQSGNVSIRRVRPMGSFFGKSSFHDREGHFLKVVDRERNAKRTLAFENILAWGDERIEQVLGLHALSAEPAGSVFWDRALTFIRSFYPTKG